MEAQYHWLKAIMMIESLLLPVSIISVIIILFSNMKNGIIVYLFLLFYFSHIYTVSVGSIDFTASRIAVIVLFLKLILSGKLRNLNFLPIDFLIIVYFTLKIFALIQNEPISLVLEREGGNIVDTAIPYLIFRVFVTDFKDLINIIQYLIYMSLPLVLFAVVQSFTGNNLIGDPNNLVRYNLYRANLIFGDYISCGLFFFMIFAFTISVKKYLKINSFGYNFILLMMLIGVLTTLSSAPYLSIIIFLTMIAFFPHRKYFPAIVIIFVSLCLMLEIYSNRHFYEIITEFSFNSQSSYYRIGLYNETFNGGMDGHWLYGYGYVGVGPGNNNENFNWFHKDLVNIYIAKLVRNGLLGLLPFLLINIFLFYYLYKSYKYANKDQQWFVWSIFSGILSWNFAFMTINAMAQIETLLFVLLAIITNLPSMMFSWNLNILYKLVIIKNWMLEKGRTFA